MGGGGCESMSGGDHSMQREQQCGSREIGPYMGWKKS